MALEITSRTQSILQKPQIQPNIVVSIDGVSTIFGSATIEEIVRIGDPGLEIGGGWTIGGFRTVEDQSVLVSLTGTSTEINQQLSPDKGAVSSVSSMKISFIDKNGEVSNLVSPGQVVADILGRRARVYLGFEGTSYPQDYITIFRGIIDDIESDQGSVSLNVAHPDQKKRNTIYERAETALNGAIDDNDTTLTVEDATNFLVGITGPDGLVDDSFTAYVKIGDEIIKYTGTTATTLTGCVRAQLGTVAAAHDDDAEVVSFYRLTGNGVELALKLLLSGWAGPYEENVEITNFLRQGDGTDITDSIFFENIDLVDRYGIAEGDYITTTGAANGANNVSLKQILTILVADGSTNLIIDDVSFVLEEGSAAVIDFRSQYDTLPSGLKMHGDEVDIDAHLLWYQRYLSSFEYDFYLKDTIEGKEFIEKQIYLPMSGYALPRKSRASMGFHSGPLPTENIVTIDHTNCTNPHQLKVRRSIGKNFYNTIIYKFEQDVLEDKYLFGYFIVNEDSKNRIEVGNKSLLIQSNGLRRGMNGENLAAAAASRLLTRYKYAAEFLDNVKVQFSVGFKIEVGDIVILDGTSLNIADSVTGTRGMAPRLFEVINKKLNIKTGDIILALVDTNLSLTARYGLISPASAIASATDQRTFVIERSYNSVYGTNEGRKWSRYIGAGVKIRNSDFSVQGTGIIESVSGNTITLVGNIGFSIVAGYIMELSGYNNQNETIKLFYTFMTDEAAFDDGEEPYEMI